MHPVLLLLKLHSKGCLIISYPFISLQFFIRLGDYSICVFDSCPSIDCEDGSIKKQKIDRYYNTSLHSRLGYPYFSQPAHMSKHQKSWSWFMYLVFLYRRFYNPVLYCYIIQLCTFKDHCFTHFWWGWYFSLGRCMWRPLVLCLALARTLQPTVPSGVGMADETWGTRADEF